MTCPKSQTDPKSKPDPESKMIPKSQPDPKSKMIPESQPDPKSQTFATWRDFVFDPGISFSRKAKDVFTHQYRHLTHYRRFCDLLGNVPPEHFGQIPLMPVQVFRDATVRPDYIHRPERIFRSSGTSGMSQSTHEIADLRMYEDSCRRGFNQFYDPERYAVLAYLPGYSDNPDSSLIAMIDHFVRCDRSGLSRFLPLDKPLGPDTLDEVVKAGKRVMLFGAAFGLLDLIDAGAPELPPESVVVETGGMKTRRREWSKAALRRQLAEGFGVPEQAVHSEYGMAEMCSQAWDTGTGRFRTPEWLKITIRNMENPMECVPEGEQGLIGVMDLANVHSLSFFLTQDMGSLFNDGTFEVSGRWDHAELRGCNFLME